jgi:lysozyme family protein
VSEDAPPAKPPSRSVAKAGAAGAIGGAAAAIIAAVFAVEGSYVANKNDPGGETNLGMTKVVAQTHGYTGDMRLLSKDFVGPIYYQDYIVKPGFDRFLALEPAVAAELVDTGINTGPQRPSFWLQQALNALSQQGKAYPLVPIDGKVGETTVKADVGLQKVRGKVQACQLIIKSLDAQQGSYYLSISLSNPKLQSFTAGWMTNRIGNVPISRCG